MKTRVMLLSLVVLLFSARAFAHPGHGDTDPGTWRHYLTEPVHVLTLAGALAGKKAVAEGPGTFTTYSPIFVALLIGVIIIVGALTFVPADALGPIVEHLLVLQGKTF